MTTLRRDGRQEKEKGEEQKGWSGRGRRRGVEKGEEGRTTRS